MTSLQVVNIDYYLGKSFLQRPFVPTPGNDNTGTDPTAPGLDLLDASVPYPIIRIFGTLQETGKTACAHIHGVFPYLYFRPLDVLDPCFDSHEQIAQILPVMQQSIEDGVRSMLVEKSNRSSSRKILHKLQIVQKIPLYGYHMTPQFFVQVQVLDPSHVSRVAVALENGVVLGKVMQAFESHIPYLLQFFQDFEISGMDWVELDWRPTPFLVSFRLDSSGKCYCSSSGDSTLHPLLDGVRVEDLFTQPQSNSLPPISSCPIEFDIHCSCIKNSQLLGNREPSSRDSLVPITFVNSLRALWYEELERRQVREISKPLCSAPLPSTQSSHRPPGESENDFKTRLKNLFRKGSELDAVDLSAIDASNVQLSQWTRNCVNRQNSYQDSFQEFSQRAENYIGEVSFSLAIQDPEEPKDREPEEAEAEEEEGDWKDDEIHSQRDADDILFTNTAFLTAEDTLSKENQTEQDSQRHHIKNPLLSSSSPHKLHGYLYEVFQDSPINLGNSLHTLQATSKQGRRKRSRRRYQSPPRVHREDSVGIESLRTPEKSSIRFDLLCSSNDDTSPWRSPVLHQDALFSSPMRQSTLFEDSTILSPTYAPPSLNAVINSFCESKSGWSHTIPHYSVLSDLPSRTATQSTSKLNQITSSEKGRFGWLPQDIKHKSYVEPGGENEFGGGIDTLKRLLIESSLSLHLVPHSSLIMKERLLVPTFFPPKLSELPAVSVVGCHEQSPLLLTPVYAGDSESSQQQQQQQQQPHQESSQQRVFFKSAPRYTSPLRSQIATPTQTQGQGNKIAVGMNVRRQLEKPISTNDSPTVSEKIRGRTTVLSMELFAVSRGDLLPNPKFDSIRLICWVSICFIAIGDREIEQRSTGILCHCHSIPILTLKSLVHGSCQLPSDVRVFPVNSEKELIQTFSDLVRNEIDPDILVGYEIQKDSWGYLIERGHSLDIPLLQELSRVPNEKPSSRNEYDKYGEEHESGIYVTGRMTINLWRRMKSELKLFSYTIGSISRHLLGNSFPEFTSKQLTTWSCHSSTLYRVIRYLMKRAELNHLFIDKLDLIRRISESARLYGVDFYSVISRGSQFKVEAVMLRVAHKKGFIAIAPSKRAVSNQAAMAVIPLVMEPQSNFYVDPVAVLDFQSLYPSLIISYNLCFSTILGQLRPGIAGDNDTTGHLGVLPYPEEYLVRNLFKTYRSPTGRGAFRNPSSPQPSISPSGAIFVGKDIREGVLPIMLKEILDTRIMIKQSMKLYTDDNDKILRRVLDARQLALKRLANVTYGYAGAGYSGRMPMAELADAVVQYGRSSLEWSASIIRSHLSWKAEVVYGDTDSLFVHLRGRSREDAHDIGDAIAHHITSLTPLDVVLKMEKVYLPCVLASKKRYVGYSFETKSNTEPHFDAKGIEVARRDQCPCTVKIQEKALRILFATKDLSEVKRYLCDQWSRIHEGGNRIPIRDFIFRREVKLGHYAKDPVTGEPKMLPPAALVACQQMNKDPRQEPPYQWRVPYVVIAGPPNSLLKDLIAPPVDILSRDSKYRLNHIYYISKQINPALDRVLNFCGIDVASWYAQMPKPSSKWTEAVVNKRLFLGRHFGSQETSSGGGGGVATAMTKRRRQQPTIKEYLPTLMCLVCGKELSPPSPRPASASPTGGGRGSRYLCVVCSSLPSAPASACNALTSRLNHLERIEKDHRVICRCCCGWSQIEDDPLSLCPRGGGTGAGGGEKDTVLVGKECCVSTDCPVLFERVRNLSKREDVSLSLLALSLTDHR